MAEYNSNKINTRKKDCYTTLKHSKDEVSTITLEEHKNKKDYEKDSEKLIKADAALRALKKYGIIIPNSVLEDEEKIEMLSTTTISNPTNNSVCISIDGEIYTISLFEKMAGTPYYYSRFNNYFTVCYKQESSQTPFIIERFKSSTPHYDINEAFKNAISTKEDPNTRLLSRAYADIETKYGPFCIHFEEDYKTQGVERYRKVSIYYGNHTQVLDQEKNLFDEESGNILNWHYNLETNEEYFNFGLYNCSRNNSTRRGSKDLNNRTKSGILPSLNREASIYFADKNDEDNHNRFGIAIIPTKINGLQISNTCSKKHSDIINETINKDHYPKIVLGDKYQQTIISKKIKENKIILELSLGDSTEELSSHPISILGKENYNEAKTFNLNDISTIINHLNEFYGNFNFKKFLINQLAFYINTHDRNNLSKLKPGLSLKENDFEDIIDELTKYSYEEYVGIVENSLESLASSLCTSVETILDGCEQFPIEKGISIKKEIK